MGVFHSKTDLKRLYLCAPYSLSITLALSAPLPLLLLFLFSIFTSSNSHPLTSRTLPLLLLLGFNEGTSLISSITTTTLLRSKFQTLKPLFDSPQKISLHIYSYLIFARTSLKSASIPKIL